jgi:hypothetical protein
MEPFSNNSVDNYIKAKGSKEAALGLAVGGVERSAVEATLVRYNVLVGSEVCHKAEHTFAHALL